MRGLVLKGFVLMLLVLAGFFREGAAETVQIGFHLPSAHPLDRGVSLMQRLFLYQAFSEVDGLKEENCRFALSDDGELIIEGQRESLDFFAEALGRAIEKVIGDVTDAEALHRRKELDAALLDDFFQDVLIQEDLEEVKRTLRSLTKMLYAAAAAGRESPPLTFVSRPSRSHHFYSLPISQTDQNMIYELIKAMGSSNYWDLIKRKKEMEKLGENVQHVHPLRFIGFIYSHPQLKWSMDKIMDDVLKRRVFLNGYGKKEGFVERMTKEMQERNLIRHIPGFAQSIGIDEREIAVFFHTRDWEGFLCHLHQLMQMD